VPTSTGAHPRTKTVRSGALAFLGLVGALHCLRCLAGLRATQYTQGHWPHKRASRAPLLPAKHGPSFFPRFASTPRSGPGPRWYIRPLWGTRPGLFHSRRNTPGTGVGWSYPRNPS
jgi:hypothetical protein